MVRCRKAPLGLVLFAEGQIRFRARRRLHVVVPVPHLRGPSIDRIVDCRNTQRVSTGTPVAKAGLPFGDVLVWHRSAPDGLGRALASQPMVRLQSADAAPRCRYGPAVPRCIGTTLDS